MSPRLVVTLLKRRYSIPLVIEKSRLLNYSTLDSSLRERPSKTPCWVQIIRIRVSKIQTFYLPAKSSRSLATERPVLAILYQVGTCFSKLGLVISYPAKPEVQMHSNPRAYAEFRYGSLCNSGGGGSRSTF